MAEIWMIEERFVTDGGAPFCSGANDWHPVNWSKYEGSAKEMADSLRYVRQGLPKREFRVRKFTPADSFPEDRHIDLVPEEPCTGCAGCRRHGHPVCCHCGADLTTDDTTPDEQRGDHMRDQAKDRQ